MGSSRLGITLDLSVARLQLERAVELAESSQTLPEEWLERTARVGRSSRTVDIAMLGTTLLARATDSRIDPFVIKMDVSDRGYSARNIADHVLARNASKYGIDLGSGSPNPINSSTYLTPRRLDEIVSSKDRASMDYLLETLRCVDGLVSV